MCNLQIGQFEKRKDVFWLILHSEREWHGGTYKPTELEESPGLKIYVISNPLTLLFIYVCVLCVLPSDDEKQQQNTFVFPYC